MLKQPQSSGDPGEYLRWDLSRGDRRSATGLCRPVGAAVRSAEKAVGGGGDVSNWRGTVEVKAVPLQFIFTDV